MSFSLYFAIIIGQILPFTNRTYNEKFSDKHSNSAKHRKIISSFILKIAFWNQITNRCINSRPMINTIEGQQKLTERLKIFLFYF